MAPCPCRCYEGNERSNGASGGLKLDISDIFVDTEATAPHMAATFQMKMCTWHFTMMIAGTRRHHIIYTWSGEGRGRQRGFNRRTMKNHFTKRGQFLFACGIVSVLIRLTLHGLHTCALLELWMLYFNNVNELQRTELAERLVKPFAHHRELRRRACLRFYQSCLSLWFRLRDLRTVSIAHTQSHMLKHSHVPARTRTVHMLIRKHCTLYTAEEKHICFQLQTQTI